MKKTFSIFIIFFVIFLAAGCGNVPGQDFTFKEKFISDFDETKAEQIIIENEQKLVELSQQQTIAKDQFIEYREDIVKTLGSDFGFEAANSFFDIADIENSETQELTRASSTVYLSLVSDSVYLDSASIIEHTYKDKNLGIKTYLKVSILSSDEQLNDFYRTYYFEKIDDDWHFSHIVGILSYAY